ncbi:serine/arginine repetitive matrix protein 2 [Caproicibacterium amylolyticum]|uniref:Serine/arginine repetitive matrix protein 2 n=1 Tax=Caproicibacterium amylolyticum TaxID=2766537 RepID=A0A7G9WG99_9FIRM|nr:serine/arginine repetitive matrix protein 2 [Caproicibacterium amylolyticum]QNO17711.1 serine/arginine repetitive matrix protein 2 [Caproicibacterium amylolyticum]
MGSTIKAQIKNFKEVQKNLKSIKAAGEKAVKRTVSDIRSRAPGWVSQEVAAVYGIKKGEVNPAGKGAKAGSISVRGETIDNLQLVYSGRVLTPTHFGMTPRSRPASQPGGRPRKYTVKAAVFKGQKKTLGSNVFLGGSASIPFKRVGNSRLPIKAVKTLSVPQMVGSDRVMPQVKKRLNEEIGKRLDNNVKNAMK